MDVLQGLSVLGAVGEGALDRMILRFHHFMRYIGHWSRSHHTGLRRVCIALLIANNQQLLLARCFSRILFVEKVVVRRKRLFNFQF